MSIPPISVQLYSLREEMKDGKHAEIFKKLGETGFTGVEGAGLYGMKAKEYRKMVNDYGMVVSSNHGPFPSKENLQEVIDLNKDLGTPFAIAGFWEDFTVDSIKKAAERVNAVIDDLEKAGITFCLHNHWQEFTRIDGRLAYDYLVEFSPKVKFQIDTYWACNFGKEVPAKMVEKYKSRTPLLHLKDGDFSHKDAPMVACGSGKQDFPAIMKATDPAVIKWAVIELDRCATDMVQAVVDSYHYLVGKDLASGRKPAKTAAK